MALSRPLAAIVAASFALVALSATAFAGPGVLDSGDTRATVGDKNVTTCEAAGLPGKTIESADVKAEVDGDKINIDVLDHTGITAVVVKGGDAYNVYLASALSGGWTDLHSPLNPNGKPAQISHWFACGEQTTTSTSPTSTTKTTTSSASTTTTTTTTATSAQSSTVATTTTTNAAAASVDNNLASTGFGSAWLIGVGAALVAAGAAVLLVLRRRRA
jgi:LPXTG-motif cell wall-anchored protein